MYTLEALHRRVPQPLRVSPLDAQGFTIEQGADYAIVSSYEDLEEKRSPEEIAAVRGLAPIVSCFQIDYISLPFVKSVICALQPGQLGWIELDIGVVMEGGAFVRRVTEDPEWNWLPSVDGDGDVEP